MASAEQPFDERELRYFLAEILKVSSIAPYELFNLIQSHRITPNWTEIALPNGRSVSACRKAYSLFETRSTTTIIPYQPAGTYEQPTPAPKEKKKRSLPVEGYHTEVSPLVPDRTLQPQQSTFPSVNAPSPSGPFAYPGPPSTSIGEPPRKKRGRPSKEEFDKRVAEAARRGEVYPPPRKRKTPRASATGVPNEAMATPGTAEAAAAGEGESPAGKRKPKQARAIAGVSQRSLDVTSGHPLPESTMDLAPEATASAGDRMQVDTEKFTRSTIPETQASDIPARESLLAGLREHAVGTDTGTMQSSYTLKDESAPRSELGSYPVTSNPTTSAD